MLGYFCKYSPEEIRRSELRADKRNRFATVFLYMHPILTPDTVSPFVLKGFLSTLVGQILLSVKEAADSL